MKICKKCGTEFEKPAYRHSLLCADCNRAYHTEYRRNRKKAGNPVVSKQMSKEWMRAYHRDYQKREDIRKILAERAKERLKNPHHRPKILARYRAKWAIATGRLIRQPCEKCGNPKTQAHHDDYSKPLDVRWLCVEHHVEFHRAERMKQP